MLTLVRHRDVPGPSQIWKDHRVEAHVDGVKVGRLTFSWIPDLHTWTLARFHEHYPYRDSLGFARFKSFHGSPFIAAVGVDRTHQRQGIGTALYREAALWLAEDWGLPLRSGDPNDNSRGLWESLKAAGEPVSMVEVKAGPRHLLDYRERIKKTA